MAILASNDAYLAINGTNVSGYATEGNLEGSAASNDVTHGFGQDWVMRSPGLRDASFSCTVAYDTTAHAAYIGSLTPGQVVSVEWGPEGTSSGKPKHLQNMVITGLSGPKVMVTKDGVFYEFSAEGADTPTKDLAGGDVY